MRVEHSGFNYAPGLTRHTGDSWLQVKYYNLKLCPIFKYI